MKSTDEFIKDMFTTRREATGGKGQGFNPFQRLVLFFVFLILAGTGLLLLPWATPVGHPLHIIDALFTSTSAICVTGLIVRDTATAFTPLGQGIIIVLIKIGGLGYMMLASAAVILMGRKISLHDRQTIKQAMNLETTEGMRKFIWRVLTLSLTMELLGGLIISVPYIRTDGLIKALGIGFFHSISAFNNAGFSVFSDNLVSQQDKLVVPLTILLLALIGGLGFFVLNEVWDVLTKKRTKFSVHSKIVFATTAGLLIAGTLGLMITAHLDIWHSFFISSICRTAGFNISEINHLPAESLFLIIPLMFIGASSGGTGGGVKTTTFALVLFSVWSTLRGKDDVVAFRRAIPINTIFKALMIIVAMIFILGLLTLLLVVIEHEHVIKILFEVASALGTVGLSVGDGAAESLCANFSWAGKLIIIVAMFIGRLGPLTLGLAAAYQAQHPQLKYPEGRVSIG